jgi:hypothetical protein
LLARKAVRAALTGTLALLIAVSCELYAVKLMIANTPGMIVTGAMDTNS